MIKHKQKNKIDILDVINEILNYKNIYENLIFTNLNSLKEFESFKYEHIKLKEKIIIIENINNTIIFNLKLLINILLLFLILFILILFNII